MTVRPGAPTETRPVSWSAEREARGTIGTRRDVYVCTDRDCPYRSRSLAAMVAHVRQHREPEPAEEMSQARIEQTTRRILAALKLDARPPDEDPPPVAAIARAGWSFACAAGTALSPVTAIAVTAGLATAAGTVPSPVPAVAVSCACACGERFDPGSRPGRRFVNDQHRKRVQRRAERARLRELSAPSSPWPPPVPASAAGVTVTARSLSAVS